MTKTLLRVPLLALLTAVLIAGLGVWTGQTASAQGPCGPATVQVPYNTAGNTYTRTGCSIQATVSYQAFEFVLVGAPGQTVHVDTCLNSNDTVLQIFQSAGGGQGAFNPGNPGVNMRGCTDDNCNGLASSFDVGGLSPGFYTIVVSNWSSTAAIAGTMQVRTPNCDSTAVFAELPVAFADPINLPCTAGRANLTIGIENLGIGDLLARPGRPEFSVTLTSVRGGAVVDAGLVGRRFAAIRTVLVASPRYLQQAGVPRRPAELASHRLIGLRFVSGAMQAWTFVGDDPTPLPPHALVVSDPEAVARAAELGLGIGAVGSHHVWPQLRAGRLKVVLADAFRPAAGELSIQYPPREHLAPRVRAVVEHLLAAWAKHPDLQATAVELKRHAA